MLFLWGTWQYRIGQALDGTETLKQNGVPPRARA